MLRVVSILCWGKCLVAVIFLLHLFVMETKGNNFELQVYLRRYRHHSSSGCSLRFCLKSATAVSDSSQCFSEKVMFDIDNDDNTATDSRMTIFNPLSFRASMGNYRLCIEIRTTGSDSIIAKFSDNISISADNLNSSMPVMIMSSISQQEILIEYLVKCGGDYYGANCSTFCRPSSTGNFICGDNGEVICIPGYMNSSLAGDVGSCTLRDPNFEETGSNRSEISGGGAAGIAIALVIILLVVMGVVAGILIWKRPWSSRVVSRGHSDDAMTNPVYELNTVEINRNETTRDGPYLSEQSQSSGHLEESSPLYFSRGDATLEESQYVENRSLFGVLDASLTQPRASSLPPGGHKTDSNDAVRQSQSMEFTESRDESSTTTGARIDPYTCYSDSTADHGVSKRTGRISAGSFEPVPESTFDDPDYEDIDYNEGQ